MKKYLLIKGKIHLESDSTKVYYNYLFSITPVSPRGRGQGGCEAAGGSI
jgi:hypothetical protein